MKISKKKDDHIRELGYLRAAAEDLKIEIENRLRRIDEDGFFEELPRQICIPYLYRREIAVELIIYPIEVSE